MCIQFTDVAQVADAARNLEILRDRDDYDRSERSVKILSGTRVEIVITLTVSRVVTGVTVRVMTNRKITVKGLTGRAVVVTTITTITTTTLVTTTGILVLDATKGTEVSNPTDLPTRVPSSPG
ncbi:hypothetical protein Tco_1526692, partial [Tanacetum coccineum]